MIFVNCPECGHKLMEGEEGSRVQVKCNKCGSILKTELNTGEVKITVIRRDESTCLQGLRGAAGKML